ncbi:MAG: TlpA family protein disulfide reductase [Gaiellaceae bacterium]
MGSQTMGKAARLKQERRAARTPPPVGKQRPAAERRRMVIWAGTAGLVVLVAIVGAVLATRSSSKAPPPAASVAAADRNAPASLVSAANGVGFHPTTEPGIGKIEDQPAGAARPPQNGTLLAVGQRAPGFTLKTPQGRQISLASFRGKAVLLEFFATWCPHCNAEAPHLENLYTSLAGQKIAFVSVNADGETAPSVFAFHRYYGLSYPALVDPSAQPGSFNREGAPGAVTNAYHVQDFPTFYVLDPQGRISWRSDGEQPDALLRRQLLAARG